MKSKTELKFEIKVGIFLLAVALLYLVAMMVGIQDAGRFLPQGVLKPTTFPRVICALMIGSALYILGKALLQYNDAIKAERKDPEGNKLTEEKIEWFPIKEFIPVLIGMLVYTALLRTLGFLLDSILLSLGTLFYLNPKRWLRNILFSLILPTLVFILFYYVLTIYLPVGIIFGGY